MNSTSPAIVAQSAVRRLPRWALLGLCAAYVMAGFWGRGPWKNGDIAALGYMLELAGGHTPWLNPLLAGLPPETDGLLAYWLGAWAVMLAPAGWSPEVVTRLPFIGMLVLTLVATWYGVYYLARSPRAQPVAFAFGGEARPNDYARALADGGLLALMACLGLARLSHETTSYLAQLCCTSLAFYAVAASPYRRTAPIVALSAGLGGLALSGGPSLALIFGFGATALCWAQTDPADNEPGRRHSPSQVAAVAGVVTLAVVALVLALGLNRWRLVWPDLAEARSLLRLLVWFAWPAWPLALWSVWRWRHHLRSRRWPLHLSLPLWFVSVSVVATFTTLPADRALLLGMPALATLAAFALPTLSRSMGALIDWFTLLFFTGAAIIIWVIWLAMQTGFPAQPAANVARLAPGFQPDFSLFPLLCALAATAAWIALVKWRAGRHRAAIWKSLVLPAGGAALGWILLMTLWLPLLDYAQSYATMVQSARALMGTAQCAEAIGLTQAQAAAFQYHGELRLQALGATPRCDWLLVGREPAEPGQAQPSALQWQFESSVWRPVERREVVLLYRRIGD
ncbi:hypothetical protein PSQ40_04375 [Curvibacter sp. HBC61]|uniref:Glycosyltransferase n=1 Tax=Curvibacter cyanobacteriorum TaxID=3026422 RepID=A0ABT5MWY1_9BURK|nr:hypothetical protein [Curvibacter sp. HBC61]MDD0837801.1 hypothetical protein [Curvibacter sp. HBC61]